MSIQELGSIGELVGAITVLATLIYLAIQTRQARIAAEETAKFAGLQATHSMLDLYFNWRRSLFVDPAHKEIIAKANAGAELTDSEQFALRYVFHDLFFAAAYSYASSSSGGSLHERQGDVDYIVLIMKENPCALIEWKGIEHVVARMGADFIELVNQRLSEDST